MADDAGTHRTGLLRGLRAARAAARAMRLIQLARRSGDPASLDPAVALLWHAVQLTGDGRPDRPRYLSNLGVALHARYQSTGDPDDLDAAIASARHSVTAAPSWHPNRAGYLFNVVLFLQSRYDSGHQDADLAEAIDTIQQALSTDLGPSRCAFLIKLTILLWTRHESTGRPEDLDEAIDVARTAAEAAAAIPAGVARCLANLSGLLALRFERTGDPADVDQAVDAARAAVRTTDAQDPVHINSMINLGNPLRLRAERFGDPADLTEAIDVVRAAVAAISPDDPRRPDALADLATLLDLRFRSDGGLETLNESIETLAAAIAAVPADHPHRGGYLSARSVALRDRVNLTSDAADADSAVAAGRAAVSAAPLGHPSRAMCQSNLSLALAARYARTEDPEDLREALEAATTAVRAAPIDDVKRAGYLANLGLARWAQYDRTGAEAARCDAFAAWREATAIGSAPASIRVDIASRWGRLAATHGVTDQAETGYATAVALLPLLAWHGLPHRSHQGALSDWTGLASAAAACAIDAGHPRRAVELLEKGRSVLWSQLLHLRGEIEDLREVRPDLAGRLDELRRILDHTDTDDADRRPSAAALGDVPITNRARRRERRMRAADEWDETLYTVRTLPGFANFLRAPALGDLIDDGEDGDIVLINISEFRCDALAVGRTGVRVIALPDLHLDEAYAQTERFLAALDGHRATPEHTIDEVLGWLWDTVTGPVLDALGHTSNPPASVRDWPRVWWCPTGPLTALPLHAAGRRQPQGPSDAVLDRVVSSYTPTVRALHRARTHLAAATPRKAAPGSASDGKAAGSDRMLLVTMPTTPYLPGNTMLPGVEAEARAVTERFAKSLTHVTGTAASVTSVLAALATHPYAHFACHGGIDVDDAASSGLYVGDGPLTIQRLSDMRLRGAELAFLSACQTARGSLHTLDEAITMAAACQLAGFRHVIATLWTLADPIAPDVARDVYAQIAPHSGRETTPAHALHTAARRLRDQHHPPAQWATYVHAGP